MNHRIPAGTASVALLGLAPLLSGCACIRPAPQPGEPLAMTAPGCRAPQSLIDLRYDLNRLAGGTMVAASGAPCPMALDQFVGFNRALFSVTGARVTTPPGHGTATVGKIGQTVTVIYQSVPGYRGQDGFTVNVLPTNLPVPVSVTVGP